MAHDHDGFADRRFLAAALLLCGVAALWLLLSPAAFKRRAMQRRAAAIESGKHTEWLYNLALERRRDGLLNDPSVIEEEARKLGYGRPGERTLQTTLDPLPTPRSLGGAADDIRQDFSWFSAFRRSIAPVLMLAIAGFVAVLFFTDLRVEDPGEERAQLEESSSESS